MQTSVALELSQPRRQALEALLAGANVTQAAEVAGVARETVSEWLNHNEAFQAALAQAQAELWEQSRNAARSLVPKALRVLSSAMDSRRPATRLRAAATLLRVVGLGRDQMAPPPAPKPTATGGDAGRLVRELDALFDDIAETQACLAASARSTSDR